MIKGNSKRGTVKPTTANRKNSETTTFSKVKTPTFNEGNFHQITVGTPCQIFVDKKTSALYITTNQTTLIGKKTQIC